MNNATSRNTLNSPSQLVINWHLTEACNYRCRYCYARWNDRVDTRELIHDAHATRRLLIQLADYFSPKNMSNPLKREMQWNSVRLNLAGGEPLLYGKQVAAIIDTARDLGLDVSMITNGSQLSHLPLADLAPKISLLGVSIDSALVGTNQAIGRGDRQGQVMNVTNLVDSIREIHQANPAVRLKINTVVNALNHEEDMTSMIRQLSPDRWKVLRMLPVVTKDLAVSDSQFSRFVERHHLLASIMCVENTGSLAESYIMIDPHGRFFQNSMSASMGGYQYSRAILQAGARDAFSDMRFSVGKFMARYERPKMAAA